MSAQTSTSDEPAPGPPVRQRLKEAVLLPCAMLQFILKMRQRFGSYVATAMLSYGVNQGVQVQLATMAVLVYFTDILHADGATMGRLFAIGRMPWSMKPLFGLVSDVVPIFGLHRNPYLVIAGLLGVVSSLVPGLFELSASGFLPFLILSALATAWPDVVVDATSAELAKDYPESASDLQSLCWGATSIGTFIGASLSGTLVAQLRPRGLLCLCSVGSLSVLLPGLLRNLPEKRAPQGEKKSMLRWLRKHGGLAGLALLLCASCVGLSLLQIYLRSAWSRAAVTLACAVVIAVCVYVVLARIAVVLARVALFLFLKEALLFNINDAMFQWLKDAEDGPHFSPVILGWLGCVGSASLFLAVVIYNRYLTKCSYRKIFAVAQTCMMVISSLDIVLVKRWNLKMGIPDAVMVLGDAATHECFRSFFYMPAFVLASKVCPKEVEATLFALLMSLLQFGGNVGTLLGSSLLEFLGVVNGNWDEFPLAVNLKSFSRALPLLLIPFLVPNLTPNDPVFDERSTHSVSEKGLPAGKQELEDSTPGETQWEDEATPEASSSDEAEAPPPDGRESAKKTEDIKPGGVTREGRPIVILGTVAEHQGQATGQKKVEGDAVLLV